MSKFDEPKITCTKCGKEDVTADWDGKGHCITCARMLALGELEPNEREAKEWEAHVELLFGHWKPDSNTVNQQLRQIIQYAQSGPFYPADMHVQLIKEVMAADRTRLLKELLAEGPEDIEHKDITAKIFTNATNKLWRKLIKGKIAETEGK